MPPAPLVRSSPGDWNLGPEQVGDTRRSVALSGSKSAETILSAPLFLKPQLPSGKPVTYFMTGIHVQGPARFNVLLLPQCRGPQAPTICSPVPSPPTGALAAASQALRVLIACLFPQSSSGDLMIRNIQLKHSGKYVCVVQTGVDSVSSAADLIVRGKQCCLEVFSVPRLPAGATMRRSQLSSQVLVQM